MAAAGPLGAIGKVSARERTYGPDDYQAEVDFLIQQGPRLTGSKAHNALIDRIDETLNQMGLDIKSDNYTFDYLSAPAPPASLLVDNKETVISSVFPYSGLTPESGITANLVKLSGPLPFWPFASGKIAVVPLSNPPLPFSAIVESWDPSQTEFTSVANPLIPATVAGVTLSAAKAAGVKGVIFAWDDSITAANAQGQQVPFTFDYAGIPAVFVAGEASKDVIAAAKRRLSATLIVHSSLIPQTPTRTVYAVVEGKDPKTKNEAIIIVTHTDGTNVIEENGHIGVLQLAQDVVAEQPQRAHIFVFTTGHFRIPAFTETGQATTRWLDDHPEFWAGGVGQRKAVAGLAIEHLGAVRFREDLDYDTFFSTGALESELLYATTPQLAQTAKKWWKGPGTGEGAPTQISRPSSFIQFGEGASLSQKQIPNVALVTAPLYLLAEWEGDERALISMDALHRQVENFRTLRHQLDHAVEGSYGTVTPPSLLDYAVDVVNIVAAVGRSVLEKIWK